MIPASLHSLDHAELTGLDRFLHTHKSGSQAMGLAYVHGFFTAVAAGPDRPEPEGWLPLMFDASPLDGSEEAGEMLGLALRLYRDTAWALDHGEELRPVLEYVQGADGDHADARPWCRGFVAGFNLCDERWGIEDRAALETPLGLVFHLADTRSHPDPEYARLCDALPQAAATIHRYWQDQAGV